MAWSSDCFESSEERMNLYKKIKERWLKILEGEMVEGEDAFYSYGETPIPEVFKRAFEDESTS